MSKERHDLLTSSQVAQRLACSTRTVHRLIDSGDLAPVQKLPGLRGANLFDRVHVEALAIQRGVASTESAA